MPPTVMMQFADRLVTYETFMTDLTARLARVIKSDAADPEYVIQSSGARMWTVGGAQVK